MPTTYCTCSSWDAGLKRGAFRAFRGLTDVLFGQAVLAGPWGQGLEEDKEERIGRGETRETRDMNWNRHEIS